MRRIFDVRSLWSGWAGGGADEPVFLHAFLQVGALLDQCADFGESYQRRVDAGGQLSGIDRFNKVAHNPQPDRAFYR